MWRVVAPKQRAASTNSSFRSTSVCARTRRAITGENTTPTATMLCTRPMPIAPVIATARMMAGKDSTVSINRLATSSTQPPMNPASKPRGTPIATATAVASTLAYRASGAP